MASSLPHLFHITMYLFKIMTLHWYKGKVFCLGTERAS